MGNGEGMNVNIVVHRLHANRIVQRMARDLAMATGWTLIEEPDESAEVNYFFPYFEQVRYGEFSATPTAAWFTHREDNHPEKVANWHAAAQAVALRTTSAPMYLAGLAEYGLAALVTPYLDRDKFSPGPPPTNHKPTIGVSGYTYRGGRKGEAFITRLMNGELGSRARIVAAGRGWPGETHSYTWSEMQEFYRSLDVYACPSLIEGIPMGVLEALSCGVPVVIPHGVGLLDSLPAAPGIHRYARGDYADMERTLRDALSTAPDREALRAATERFTLRAWADDHRRAFEGLLSPIHAGVKARPDWRGRAGVFIVAYGDPSRRCAMRLVESIWRHMPGLQRAVASDAPLGVEDVFICQPDADVGGRSVKTRIDELAPAEWEYVLYLDADTELTADVSFLFDLLRDGWDAFFCIDASNRQVAKMMLRRDNKDEAKETFRLWGADDFLQFNGGVFGYHRNERTAAFLRDWHAEWDRYGKRDQAALDRALYHCPIRLYVLGQEWNTSLRYLKAERSAGIVHHQMEARRVGEGVIWGRLDSEEAWARVLC
jgi:hypothetical protein